MLHDAQYLDLSQHIVDHGVNKMDRTGTGTRGVFGTRMRFNLKDNRLPLLTTKKVNHHAVVHELLWMLSGDTNVKYLKDNNVGIWDSWVIPSSALYRRYTVDERVDILKRRDRDMHDTLARKINSGEINRWTHKLITENTVGIPIKALVSGELPKIYQHQWRQWEDTRLVENTPKTVLSHIKAGYTQWSDANAPNPTASHVVMQRRIDQIQNALDQLNTNPDSRRIVVSAWNVAELEEMALPPCHALFQFYTEVMTLDERRHWLVLNHFYAEVADYDAFKKAIDRPGVHPDDYEHGLHDLLDKHRVPRRWLSCQLYQRSADTALGVPFNIVQYSLLTHLVGRAVGMAPKEFVWVGGDTHLYSDQFCGIEEQLRRSPKTKQVPRVKFNSPETDLFRVLAEDLEIVDYHPHAAIKFPAAAI